MADKNLFNIPEQTSIADTDKAAFGSGVTNAFNITWLNIKNLLSNLFALKSGDNFTGTISVTEEGNSSEWNNAYNKVGTTPSQEDANDLIDSRFYCFRASPSAINYPSFSTWHGIQFARIGDGSQFDSVIQMISRSATGAGLRFRHGIGNSSGGYNFEQWQDILTSINSNNNTTNWTCNDLNYYGSLNNQSDERVKVKESDIVSDMASFLEIKPVKFRYNNNTKDIHFGFIAQELQEVYPELVSVAEGMTVKDGIATPLEKDIEGNYIGTADLLMVKPLFLIPIIVANVQEVIKNQKSIEERLEALENGN